MSAPSWPCDFASFILSLNCDDLVHVYNCPSPCVDYPYGGMGLQGWIQHFGRGRGLITIVTSGGGYGRGRAPSCDSQGVWGEAPAAFLTFVNMKLKISKGNSYMY